MKKNVSLKQKYEREIKPALGKEFGITNTMAVPKILKIIVNMGTGEALKDKQKKEGLINNLASITGQKPKVQPAKVSVAGFGIRQGNPVGLTVTLRGEKMYAFLEKLIAIVLPRLRDFRGVSKKSFDKHGNYNIGLDEYAVIPEVDIAKVEGVRGLEVTIVTSTDDKKLSERLLELMGMPFVKE